MSLTPLGRSPLPSRPMPEVLTDVLGFGTLRVDSRDQSRARKIRIWESSPAVMSLFRFGVKSKAQGVLVCSWRVPRCLLLAADLLFVSDKAQGGGADVEVDRVYRFTRSSGEPVARMRLEDFELDLDVDGAERATQRSGAVCAVNRNESENAVLRVTSCSIAASVRFSAAWRVVELREREVTGIEAMKP